MPIRIAAGAPTLVIRRSAYEHTGLARAAIDARLGLMPDEFRVEDDLVAIGPVHDVDAFQGLVQDLETLGLSYYDDFFELSGNFPGWLSVLVAASETGRSNPSHPQR